MRAAVLSPRLSPFDAVSNDARAEAALLQKHGFEARLFCESLAPDFVGDRHISSFSELLEFLRKDSIVIFHYSSYWKNGIDFLAKAPCPVFFRYHNITPADFFAPWNKDYAESCRRGREALKQIVNFSNIKAFLADSTFNQKELEALGARPVFVLPPFHASEGLLECKADLNWLSNLRSLDTQNLLTVGRIVPNKGHADLLRGFALYHNELQPKSRLLVAGGLDPQLSSHHTMLENIIKENNIEGAVNFTGALDEAALKAAFLASDLYVHTSRHEGFCVPLLEAQALAVPVLAFSAAAVPETLGQGGLLLEDGSPEMLAAAMYRILSDAPLQKELIRRGLKNYEERFAISKIEEDFLHFIESRN